MAGAVQVDDNDSSIVYSGQWIISLGNKNEYNLTAHGTFENGSTVTFSFFGTSVMWFGTIPGGLTGPSSAVAFAVDGDQASSKTAILPMSLPKSVITSHLWYSSPILSNGPHTVVATVLNAQPEIPLWIDYLNYTSSGLPVDVPNAPYSGTTSSASVVPETSEAPSPAISMTPSPIASPAQVPQEENPRQQETSDPFPHVYPRVSSKSATKASSRPDEQDILPQYCAHTTVLEIYRG
ncbi:hypothetical protein PsYK624_148600 [Phanerochaete sordida]|uniref:Uncharacterized protein n=1 Tax=Phanerochaete sordida TaxID=48140 RepID=A0A9P3GPR9_9APHY|nr:hypothetical protein PsYK624_148600 [Phanerochaete sordida]